MLQTTKPEPALIPRKTFFSDPDHAMVQISPDGTRLSWLAPHEGVLNVWIADRDNIAAAHAVTHDTGRGIRTYSWAHTNNHLLYLQDKNGDENWRLYAVDLATEKVLDLTPFEGVQARLQARSHQFPAEVIVAMNNRNPQWHDIYRVNVISGEMILLLQNDRFSDVTVDNDFRVAIANEMTSEGGGDLYVPVGKDWQLWERMPPEDILTTGPEGFDKTNRILFMGESRGRNTSALMAVDLRSKQSQLLAEDAKTDVAEILFHPTLKHVQAVRFIYERARWQILDPSIEADFAHLKTIVDGEISIVSRSLDDQRWVVVFVLDDGPARFYHYSRADRTSRFLFTQRKGLESQPLATMHSTVIASRDGLELVAYYTLPMGSDSNGDGIPDHPLPMVFKPHGGPWSRDYWGFSPQHQWLANRGYAVLCVNFRASTGFGKAFINAGNREWGGKILDDQVDAVQWAIRAGVADPKRIAVMGGSFGGYSTLAGLTFTPELFACGIDLVGVANLITWINSVPPYWKPALDLLINRVGDPNSEEGLALLKKHSPLTYVDRICRPLLIGQGANDPRVRQAESDQIADSMTSRGIPVTYVLYPDEGHGFARPQNNLSFNAIAEAFLAKCLGGRCEPIGDDFQNSSLQVIAGAEGIPGLSDALALKASS
jgi:dipeptidyl aminopeptidase/acylaminoacyl peptidase